MASFLRLKSRHRVIRSPLSRPGAVAARLARQCKPTTYLEEALASTQVLHRPSLAERAAIGSGREVVDLAQNLQDVSFRVKINIKGVGWSTRLPASAFKAAEWCGAKVFTSPCHWRELLHRWAAWTCRGVLPAPPKHAVERSGQVCGAFLIKKQKITLKASMFDGKS